jgi:hypothetical protein
MPDDEVSRWRNNKIALTQFSADDDTAKSQQQLSSKKLDIPIAIE